MAISSWPFESQPTTEAQYSRLFRELQDNGVAAPFGTGDLAVTATGTNIITVAPGNAMVRGFMFQSTAAEARPVPVITSGAHRQDLVVLRLNTNTNAITIEIVQGTADTVPAPTQTWPDDSAGVWELPLAAIDTTSAGIVTVSSDRRAFLGDRWQTWTTLTRPTSPRLGKTGYNATTSKLEWWNGLSWSTLTDTGDTGWITLPGTAPATGTGSLAWCKVRKVGFAVYLSTYIYSPGLGNSNWTLGTLPDASWLPADLSAAESDQGYAAAQLYQYNYPVPWIVSALATTRSLTLKNSNGNSISSARVRGFLWVTG